jgi:hypothetical protein
MSLVRTSCHLTNHKSWDARSIADACVGRILRSGLTQLVNSSILLSQISGDEIETKRHTNSRRQAISFWKFNRPRKAKEIIASTAHASCNLHMGIQCKSYYHISPANKLIRSVRTRFVTQDTNEPSAESIVDISSQYLVAVVRFTDTQCSNLSLPWNAKSVDEDFSPEKCPSTTFGRTKSYELLERKG